MKRDMRRNTPNHREYFKDAMEGKISISDVLDSQVKEGEEVQILAVPIWKDGVSCGVIFGIVNLGTMDKLMENVTGSDIYTQIVDSKGNYVTRYQNKDTLIQNKNVFVFPGDKGSGTKYLGYVDVSDVAELGNVKAYIIDSKVAMKAYAYQEDSKFKDELMKELRRIM